MFLPEKRARYILNLDKKHLKKMVVAQNGGPRKLVFEKYIFDKAFY